MLQLTLSEDTTQIILATLKAHNPADGAYEEVSEALVEAYDEGIRGYAKDLHVVVPIGPDVLSLLDGVYLDNFHDRGLDRADPHLPSSADEMDYASVEDWAVYDMLDVTPLDATDIAVPVTLADYFKSVVESHTDGYAEDDPERQQGQEFIAALNAALGVAQ